MLGLRNNETTTNHGEKRTGSQPVENRGLGLSGAARVRPIAAFFLLLALGSCRQDPIFDYIAGETAPTEALIQGSPSKIVSLKDGNNKEFLYISNGRIWEYEATDPNAHWNRVATQPDGYVLDVASANGALYALTIHDQDVRNVWERDGSGNWGSPLSLPNNYALIQNIFGADDALFATGSRRSGSSEYAILGLQGGNLTLLKETGGAWLTGAGKVGTDYFLATWGNGIYKADSGFSSIDLAQPLPSAAVPANIAGLLQAQAPQSTGTVILGVSGDGHILSIDSSGITVDPTGIGGKAYTGAFALIDITPSSPNNHDKLLLLGYRGDSTFQNGYRELTYNSGDLSTHTDARSPGTAPSSVEGDGRQYESSLGRYPVTALWVPSGGNPPLLIFAAANNQGLYSYRNRPDGGWQWNHEE
jgi:hypothetical protein